MEQFNFLLQNLNRVFINFYFALLFLFSSEKILSQPTLYPNMLSAPVGATFNIGGANFIFSNTASENIVYFGGTRANVLSATATQLTVVVPAGSFYAPIAATNQANLTAYSYIPFFTSFQDNAIPTLTVNSFAAKIDFPAGSGATGITAGDFNGDGKPDIAVVDATNYIVSIYRNIGTAGTVSFSAKTDIPTANGPTSLSIADIDGDGKLDMVVANASSNSVSVFRNTSLAQTISFANRIDFTTGNTPYMCTLNDFDGDGKIDVAVVNRSNDNSVSVLRNTSTAGQITFASKIDLVTGNYPIGIASCDINQDSKPDMAVVNYFSNTVSVFKNTSSSGSVSFDAKLDFPTGAYPISIAIGDINKDFRQDLVVANFVDNSVSVLKHSTPSNNVSFDAKIDFPAGTGPDAVALNDMDGDGSLDVVTANQTANSISVLKNISDPAIQIPTLDPKLDYTTGNLPSQIFIADFDTDGKPDIATANFNNNTISVLRSVAGDDAPVITSISPQSAAAGATVIITGKNFNNISSVVFGGTPVASYTLLNDSTINAVLGIGASGKVAITTPVGVTNYSGFVFNYDHGPLRIINTVAGNGATGYGGDDGNALSASFDNAFALSTDTSSGNVYITDGNNFRMRKLNVSTGTITTVAGNGTYGFSGDGGPATGAQIYNYQGGSTFDKSGNFYFADMTNRRIRKVVAATGIITTVAGGGVTNADDIPATTASIGPRGVAVDPNGNLYIADNSNAKIRKVDAVTGLISTVAGTGVNGYNGDNIPASTGQLNRVQNLALDKNGNIFIADLSNNRIRKVDALTGIITTVAGNGQFGTDGDGGLATKAQINNCWSVALDSAGNLYFGDAGRNKIRRVDALTGIITTIAGNGSYGTSGEGGNALNAQIGNPTGIVVDKKGNVYTTSLGNVIRKISFFNTDVSVCPAGSTSFTSEVTGNTYSWQYDGGSNGTGFIDIAVTDMGFTGVKTATMSIPTVYTFLNGWQFRCVVNGAPGKTFTLKIAEAWNGSANSAWENAANWNCNVVPDYGTDVFINSGAVIINSNASCRSITVKPGASVIVNAGFTLTVNH